jgi:hypothetical protein
MYNVHEIFYNNYFGGYYFVEVFDLGVSQQQKVEFHRSTGKRSQDPNLRNSHFLEIKLFQNCS